MTTVAVAATDLIAERRARRIVVAPGECGSLAEPHRAETIGDASTRRSSRPWSRIDGAEMIGPTSWGHEYRGAMPRPILIALGRHLVFYARTGSTR